MYIWGNVRSYVCERIYRSWTGDGENNAWKNYYSVKSKLGDSETGGGKRNFASLLHICVQIYKKRLKPLKVFRYGNIIILNN